MNRAIKPKIGPIPFFVWMDYLEVPQEPSEQELDARRKRLRQAVDDAKSEGRVPWKMWLWELKQLQFPKGLYDRLRTTHVTDVKDFT